MQANELLKQKKKVLLTQYWNPLLELEVETFYKYLGIYVTHNLTWNKHAEIQENFFC